MLRLLVEDYPLVLGQVDSLLDRQRSQLLLINVDYLVLAEYLSSPKDCALN